MCLITAVFQNSLPALKIHNTRDVNYRFLVPSGEYRNAAYLYKTDLQIAHDALPLMRQIIRARAVIGITVTYVQLRLLKSTYLGDRDEVRREEVENGDKLPMVKLIFKSATRDYSYSDYHFTRALNFRVYTRSYKFRGKILN